MTDAPLRPDRAPDWMQPLLAAARDVDAITLSNHGIPAPPDGRRAEGQRAAWRQPHGCQPCSRKIALATRAFTRASRTSSHW